MSAVVRLLPGTDKVSTDTFSTGQIERIGGLEDQHDQLVSAEDDGAPLAAPVMALAFSEAGAMAGRLGHGS